MQAKYQSTNISASIKFDNQELVGTTYVPRFVKHESSPERESVLLPITRQNGSVRVSSRYGTKIIYLQGIITGTSQANLEANIDTMKELLSRIDKNLDIDWNGSTRRYVATCQKHEFDRDHFHLLFVPWTAEFIVPAGIGKDTASTSLYDTSSITATTTAITLTFAGSAQPKPIFTIDMTTVGSAQVIKLLNNDTGEYMKIDGPFTNGDQVIVDCNNMTVKKNTVEIPFRGSFPNFYVGGNDFRFIIIGDGSNENQYQYDNNGSQTVNYNYGSGSPFQAQSFVPTESGYIEKLQLDVLKNGNPGGYMNFIIAEDNNGIPDSDLSQNSYQIAAAAVPSPHAFTDAPFVSGTRKFVTAGKRYWIVLNPNQATGTDISNFFGWMYSDDITDYAYGKAMVKPSASGTYVNGTANSQISPARITAGDFQMTFRVYLGSGGAASHSLRLRASYTKLWL
jgi:hypothetical protein